MGDFSWLSVLAYVATAAAAAAAGGEETWNSNLRFELLRLFFSVLLDGRRTNHNPTREMIDSKPPGTPLFLLPFPAPFCSFLSACTWKKCTWRGRPTLPAFTRAGIYTFATLKLNGITLRWARVANDEGVAPLFACRPHGSNASLDFLASNGGNQFHYVLREEVGGEGVNSTAASRCVPYNACLYVKEAISSCCGG